MHRRTHLQHQLGRGCKLLRAEHAPCTSKLSVRPPSARWGLDTDGTTLPMQGIQQRAQRPNRTLASACPLLGAADARMQASPRGSCALRFRIVDAATIGLMRLDTDGTTLPCRCGEFNSERNGQIVQVHRRTYLQHKLGRGCKRLRADRAPCASDSSMRPLLARC